MTNERLPTAKEIDATDTPDGQHAVHIFLGKNIPAAEEYFEQHSFLAIEDLSGMGPVGFRYYVVAAVNYLKGENSVGDDSMASAFGGLVAWRINQDSQGLTEVLPVIRGAVQYVLEHVDKFDFDLEDGRDTIYGDVAGDYRELLRRLDWLAAEAAKGKPYATNEFLGKNLATAEAEFSDHPSLAIDNLQGMRGRAYCFHIAALINYLRSNDSVNDHGTAHHFRLGVAWRLDLDRQPISEALPVIYEGIQYVLDHLDKYGFNLEEKHDPVYGDVKGDFRKVLETLELLSRETGMN
jgi:hypothetical protein